MTNISRLLQMIEWIEFEGCSVYWFVQLVARPAVASRLWGVGFNGSVSSAFFKKKVEMVLRGAKIRPILWAQLNAELRRLNAILRASCFRRVYITNGSLPYGTYFYLKLIL